MKTRREPTGEIVKGGSAERAFILGPALSRRGASRNPRQSTPTSSTSINRRPCDPFLPEGGLRPLRPGGAVFGGFLFHGFGVFLGFIGRLGIRVQGSGFGFWGRPLPSGSSWPFFGFLCGHCGRFGASVPQCASVLDPRRARRTAVDWLAQLR